MAATAIRQNMPSNIRTGIGVLCSCISVFILHLSTGCLTDGAAVRALTPYEGDDPAPASTPDLASTPSPTFSLPERAAQSSTRAPVLVRVLSRQRPEHVQLRGPRVMNLRAQDSLLLELEKPLPQPLKLPRGLWRVKAPRDVTRVYEGALTITARNDEVVVVLSAPLEQYVAEVVASESEPETHPEALKALAVVVRTFARSQRGRHQEADLCDLAHCQVFRATPPSAHRRRAGVATLATEGRVLLLGDGMLASPAFHSACGGHTADPGEIFGGLDLTGAAAVPDPDCPAMEWDARVSRSVLQDAVQSVFRSNPGASEEGVSVQSLQLRMGAGGWLATVTASSTGITVRGDLLFRELGARLGWGVVRSGRFTLEPRGDLFLIRGTGRGHGVGLCQLGAQRRAQQGQHWERILRAYFPKARAGSAP